MITEHEYTTRIVDDFFRLVDEGHIKLKFTAIFDNKTEERAHKKIDNWHWDVDRTDQIIERVIYDHITEQVDSNVTYGRWGTEGSREEPVIIKLGF